MVCISELRGLQTFQTKHPETVVVAMNISDDKEDSDAVTKLIKKQKLDALRVATGKEWQTKFGVSEEIPVTVVVDDGKVRVIHDAVIPDPVLFLEADLKAIHSDQR